MTRFGILFCMAALCLISMGCCAPMAIGPGCDTMGCNDCNGLGSGAIVAATPVDTLRQLRRSLTCGSGCGETYIGEWISTPPDVADPCSRDQFVGGASKCQPFCWTPGTLLGGLSGRLGGRYCDGAESSAPCGCGIATCGGGCGEVYGGEVYSGEVITGGYIDGGTSVGSSCGCATCSANSEVGSPTRIAGRIPSVDPMSRRMEAQVRRIRR